MSSDDSTYVDTETPLDLGAEGDAQAEAIEQLAAAEGPELGGADPDDEALLEGGQTP